MKNPHVTASRFGNTITFRVLSRGPITAAHVDHLAKQYQCIGEPKGVVMVTMPDLTLLTKWQQEVKA